MRTSSPAPIDWGDYALLDSGGECKLERFGSIVLWRPSPQSLWRRRLDRARWESAHAVYHRSNQGGGSWEQRAGFPESWPMRIGGLQLKIQPTGFGHLGLFPEQVPFWAWIRQRCESAARPLELLNLFAYTGGSSLAAAAGGAVVTHCDASKGVVSWARENAAASRLQDASVRWIVDDVGKFLAREQRRERRYDAIVLDPPSFGRGPKGEVFKLERDIAELLDACVALLSSDAQFLLLSAHTPGVGPMSLANLLEGTQELRGGSVTYGEMSVPEQEGARELPSGTWAAWCVGEPPPGAHVSRS